MKPKKSNDCNHHEDINSTGLGTCRLCGQQRQYNQENQLLPPVIVKEGNLAAPGEKTKLKMTKALRAELQEVGPEEFCRRHGYGNKAHGIFTQLYRKWRKESMPLEPLGPRQAPLGRLTPLERSELLEIGPTEFCQRHGFPLQSRGVSAIIGTYNLMKAKEGVETCKICGREFAGKVGLASHMVSHGKDEIPAGAVVPSDGASALRILIETNDRGKIGEIMNEIHLDNLLKLPDVKVEMSLTLTESKG